VRKNIKKLIKLKKPKKNNQKNQTVKKIDWNFFKNRPVQFGFGFTSLKPKKPNRNRKKPSQTEKNQVKPI
jgi:hypothetical protein